MNRINAIIEEGKQRHAEAKRAANWLRRAFWPVSAISGFFTLRSFFRNSGELSIPLMAVGALTAFLVYYAIPLSGNTVLSGVRLFIRRGCALLIDLFVVSIVIVPVMTWYRTEVQSPDDILQIAAGRILMVALWLAFLYFVIFEWWYKASIGKRIVGLKISNADKTNVGFLRSFIRAFLSLPLPVLCGVCLNFLIISHSRSNVRLVVGDGVKEASVALIPLSILLLGGNQSIADRLTNTLVRAEHETPHLLPAVGRKRWLALGIAVLAWAAIHPSLYYFSMLKPTLDDPTRGLPPAMQVAWIDTEPQTTGILWSVLPLGLRNPTYGIRSIYIWEEKSIQPITLQADESNFIPSLNSAPYLQPVNDMRVVTVTLARERPSLIKILVVQNYAAFISQNVPAASRPFLSMLQIRTENEYGLFFTAEEENFLLCAVVSNNKPVTFYSPVRPRGAAQFEVSLDHLGSVLIGAGIPSQSEF